MNKTICASLILIIATFTSCSVLQQTSEMKTFGKCEFRIESTRNMKLAGVNMQDKTTKSQLSLIDITKIGAAVASGSLPLTFELNIAAKNPNPGLAAMNKLDWILIIDDAEMTRGVLNQRVEIPANSIAQFPVQINFDVMKSLNGKSADALINFALNLAGTGTRPTRIKLKAKPTILIGTTPVEYPGYITIRQEFGAQ
jgi:hypothetical protein